jgi:orotidine-5'-phosphate decarboxylase
MPTFSDRLAEAVARYGPLCVGLDPRVDMLPAEFAELPPVDAFERFCLKILDLVRPHCGVVKPQAAFFELLGGGGFEAMDTVLKLAREKGFVTILDGKRGDIASTATAYAEAAFGPTWDADAVTVNPYMGYDAVEPFLAVARKTSPARGVFALVRTSNPDGGRFQNLECEGKPLYRHVAEAVAAWNDGHGDVGAVVGATNPAELKELREAIPDVWFLVPGYGAQGGTAKDVKAAYWAGGGGAIVNSSRGVVFPYHRADTDWELKVINAAMKAQAELRG